MISVGSSKEGAEEFDEQGFDEDLRQIVERELDRIHLHSVHADNITQLPERAHCLADSERCPNEIWVIDQESKQGEENKESSCKKRGQKCARVLGIASHPEFNSHYVEENIVQKMYENGKIDDM